MTATATWCILLAHTLIISALPSVVKIGAIFPESYKGGSTELAFKYAVYRVNKDKQLLPQSTLVYDIQYAPERDSFRATKKACNLLRTGVRAIFGTAEPNAGSALGALCEALDVPHIEASPHRRAPAQFSINLHPSRKLLDKAFADLFGFLNWTRVGVLYEDYGVGELNLVGVGKEGRDIYARRVTSQGEYRVALSELKQQGIRNIILDTNPDTLAPLFRAILQLQMNSDEFHYIFSSFDMETFDLEDFYYNRVNMSGWRLVSQDSVQTRETLQVMQKFHPIGASILKEGKIKTEAALIYDAVMVLTKGLAALQTPVAIVNITCDVAAPWEHGLSLYNYINSVRTDGLTGPIEFTEGIRTNFKLELLRLVGATRSDSAQGPLGVRPAGRWSPSGGLELTDPAAYKKAPPPNVTLIVVTKQEIPYVMVKEGWNLQGNARFEGFCIDLLARVAARAGFHYQLSLVADELYGARDPKTGLWNGLVRELMDGKADLAVASMTINYAREEVIDFTKPFMNLGIGILFKVPTSQPTRLFSFLNPLAIEIWLYVLAAYILVSFTLFVMARFSPYEWATGPHICGHEPKLVTNQFSVSNSFWFIIGTFLRQGSGLNPKATSTRVVGGIWWFFTLIILSSYTANLAAFLTVERTVIPIQSAADLASQTQIPYGTLNGGSTMTFFRDSNIEIYQRMWRRMSEERDRSLVPSYEEGVKRVLQGNYAFLMESTMLDHRVQRDCNLTQVGGLLDSKGYGIATPKGSEWRDKISLAILELQEKGVIQLLYDKWWRSTGDVCNREGKDSKANPLGVQNIGGVFVVLLCGLAIAILVAILEFCWHTKKSTAHGRQSLCSEMGQELRLALKGSGNGVKNACGRCETHVPAPRTYKDSIDTHMEMKELRWS